MCYVFASNDNDPFPLIYLTQLFDLEVFEVLLRFLGMAEAAEDVDEVIIFFMKRAKEQTFSEEK